VQQSQVLNNRYRVDGLLGNGGMALVYVGTDTLLRRRVAIKVLRDQYASDDDFVKRFFFEAQSAAKLSHPNVVNVYDFGHEEHAYYIVMELVEGSTLGELLTDERVLPEPVAVDYAIQIAGGLAYAHRQGLLHRDVKPANILVTQDDVVKLSDFGIARAVSEHTLGVTQPGMVMGSVAYISPEQAQGKELDERSDLYSVGVVLYQMLTGALPFSGETPVAIALKHVSEPAPPIDPATSGVSPAVAQIVARLLRKEPVDRFASATELASALREARERPNVTQADDFSGAPTQRFGAVSPPKPPPRRSIAPDRPAQHNRNGGDVDEELVEVAPRRFDVRWLLMPLLLVLAVAVGFFALRTVGPTKDIVVPDLVDMNAVQAQQTLFQLGLRSNVSEETSETVPQDRVLRQDPLTGTKLAKGDLVALVVSSGLPRVEVPDVGGYAAADAQRRLSDAKLQSKIVSVYSATVPAGQVMQVNPGVGSSVREGTTIALTVSKGVQPVTVPKLVGISVDAARARLRSRGLALMVGQQTESDTIPANTVASQDPQAGATLAPNSTVTVVVSTGSAAVPVPDVGGKSADDARTALAAGGFTAKINWAIDAANAPQTVIQQVPTAGQRMPKGTTVTLTIPVPGSIPDVTGQTLDAAKKALSAAGYQVGNIVYTQQAGVPDGTVVQTEPAANTNTSPGESVNIQVEGTPPP
jgi:beta-lactam-binding protein with PASTA domain/serine/threonine protein kinase